jgi:hypothetical protein
MSRFEVVVAGASVASRDPQANEDRLLPFWTQGERRSSGMVLCDGVGSRPESAAMAEEVARMATDLLSHQGVWPGVWELDWRLTQMEMPGCDGTTTLLAVGADESGLVAHMLLGNGSIVEIVPTRLPSGAIRLLWSSIALPQVDWSRGRASLQSVLPARYGETASARGYRQVMPGRTQMYLACSDGVLAEEERLIGRAKDGSRWQPVPILFATLIERIGSRWDELAAEPSSEGFGAGLAGLLERALGEAAADRAIGDDASVGAVLVRPGREPARGPAG